MWPREVRECKANLGVTIPRDLEPKEPSTSWVETPEGKAANYEEWRSCCHFLSNQDDWKVRFFIQTVTAFFSRSRRFALFSLHILSIATYNSAVSAVCCSALRDDDSNRSAEIEGNFFIACFMCEWNGYVPESLRPTAHEEAPDFQYSRGLFAWESGRFSSRSNSYS